MALGNLFAPQSGGPGELLRTQLQIYGGATPVSMGETDLIAAINRAMQVWPAPDIASLALQPTGASGSTLDRTATAFVQTNTITSGTLQMSAMFIPINTLVTNIVFVTGSTAAVTPTNSWACLCDNNRNLLAISANGLTTAIPASTVTTFPIANIAAGASTTYTTLYGGLYYVGLLVTAATPPTFQGAADQSTTVKNIPPILTGTSTTGLTVPSTFPTQYIALTASAAIAYSYVT